MIPDGFEVKSEEDKVNIGELLVKYLYHWPVFFLGVFIAVTIAFLYLRYTKPVFEITSTLLIKDEKKGMPSEDILNQLDLFGGSKVVENELEILQSKTLMSIVVKRLNLNIDLKAEGRVVNSDVYEKRPVSFQTFEMDERFYGKELKLRFLNDNQYALEDIKTGRKIVGTLNQMQRNYLGIYRIDRTPYFHQYQKEIFSLFLNDPLRVTNDFLANLSVSVASKQSTVLKLTFQSTVPKKGKDILNTLIQVYNEASLADKNKTTQSTIKFIDERLKLISGELTDVEKDVEGFKSSQGLTDISSEASLFLDNVKANDIQLNEVNIKLNVIKDMERYLNSGSADEKLPISISMDDPVLQGQLEALSKLQLEREKLLATTQPNNPLLDPVTKQIESSKAGIRSTINNIESSLISAKKSLSANNSKFEGSIKKIPGQERQFISIKRQQTIKENLYLYLLQKKEEAALSYASAVADSRIVDSAFSTDAPIKPKKSLTYLIALIAGIILPVGYLYVKNLINNKVLSSSDISKMTGASILGEVVYEASGEAIVVHSHSRKAIAEQFRAIRTNLQYVQGKRDGKQGFVTLFTSSMSGEGKSFVASNIAAAMSISGRRTVLLELDLRKPKVSKYLKLDNKLGLSNYLIGKATKEAIIQSSGVNDNFSVIGSGPIPPNPSELLINKEIEELISYLRDHFDEIIIDSPPIGLVTDAQILARLADSTIYLVRHGVTFKQQIEQLDLLYRSKKFPKLNIIFNGVTLGGRYGYGYGYGYGYYSDDAEHDASPLKNMFKDFFKRF